MKGLNILFVAPLIILSLFLAVWSGWLRIGWNLPLNFAASQHGALMVNSFLASLIFLERAVAFRQRWVLLLPLINAFSGVFFLTGFLTEAYYCFTLGSMGFMAVCIYFLYHHKHFYYVVFLAGATCLVIGNIILLAGHSYVNVVFWWMGFLLLTIVAERLELSRFLKLTNFKRGLLLISVTAVLLSLCVQNFLSNYKALALSFLCIALWLLRYDMARYSIKLKGQHRYSGLLLITGYAWLFITGIILWFYDLVLFAYDAALHSFFIGFVFAMIFSHAPVILPAVAKQPIKIYKPVLYIWFLLLQLSLWLRIIADLWPLIELKKLGGGLNGLIIIGFFITAGIFTRKELIRNKQVTLRANKILTTLK